MCRKKIFLVILLFLTFTKAFPAVFVVTSNADSGPGTLREALTLAAANGNVVMDYINFNLPDLSAAGRTITLLSQLSPLSPNLVIDATTQPGIAFGVSDAKVKIFDGFLPPSLNAPYILQASNLGNFTISGLWLDALTYNGQDNAFYIDLGSSASITITHCLMPGGNLNISTCGSFTCQSNMIGYLPDGITGFPTTVTVTDVLNVAIGGTTAEGNLLSGALKLNMNLLDQDWTYLISNNKLGTDFTGTTSSLRLFSDGRIAIESGQYNPPSPGKMHGTISNNLIENFQGVGILVSGFGDVAIKGNAIGTDYKGKIDFTQFEPDYVKNSVGSPNTGIQLQVGIDAVVGGSNPGDANVIGYIKNGILEQLADKVVISQNSIFCYNKYNFNIHDFVTQAYAKPLPQVQINAISNNSISGTATPGARVELFSNGEGECLSCDPRDFFTNVTADGQGNWSYNGLLPANIVASAIFNGQTSLFTKAKVEISNLKVTQPQCGDNTGAIEGIRFYNAGQMRWIDQNGKVISNSLNVNNLPPGKYKFKIGTDVCGAESNWIELFDKSIKIDASSIKMQNPACSQNGAISGLSVKTYKDESYTAVWLDESLNNVGNSVDVTNLIPGKYTLTITGKVTGCSQTYGPVILTTVTGPGIDKSNVIIKPAGCNENNGSVTNLNITGTGTVKYSWKNAQGQEVATTKDLNNQSKGAYTLQVSDDSQCSILLPFEIPDFSNVTMSAATTKVTPATCGEANGSITGLGVSGATNISWIDGNGQPAGNKADLTNVPAGDYQLTISDDCGHQLSSPKYHIDGPPKTVFPELGSTVNRACNGQSNGAINLVTDPSIKAYRWVDGQGNTIGSGPSISNRAPGDLKLYLTDQNGCESFYKTFTIPQVQLLQFEAGSATVTDDQCTASSGSIKNIRVTGGAEPYSFTWTNAAGQTIGTSADLTGLAAGDYSLFVTDVSNCNTLSANYTIRDIRFSVPPPSVNNIQVCSPGSAILSVNQPIAGYSYRLYDSENDATPAAQSVNGKFSIDAKGNTTFYVSQLDNQCESQRTAVQVTVGISALNIANAITPNGDGINDYWNISGIENYPAATVQIFTRNGQKVFDSRGYKHPFDGTSNGKPVPGGVYYYIINLNSNCSLLSGNLTIIR